MNLFFFGISIYQIIIPRILKYDNSYCERFFYIGIVFFSVMVELLYYKWKNARYDLYIFLFDCTLAVKDRKFLEPLIKLLRYNNKCVLDGLFYPIFMIRWNHTVPTIQPWKWRFNSLLNRYFNSKIEVTMAPALKQTFQHGCKS